MENFHLPVCGEAEPWWFLASGACGPAWNMAWDEALLEAVGRLGHPVLRTYGWAEPCATFGYFQRHAEVAARVPLRPLTRRPTGGELCRTTGTGRTVSRCRRVIPGTNSLPWTVTAGSTNGSRWPLRPWVSRPSCHRAAIGKDRESASWVRSGTTSCWAGGRSAVPPSVETAWDCSCRAASNRRLLGWSARLGKSQ